MDEHIDEGRLRAALSREVDERIADDVAGAVAPLLLEGPELVSALAAALEASLLATLASQHLEADMRQVVRARVRDEAGEVAVRAVATLERGDQAPAVAIARVEHPAIGVVLRIVTEEGNITIDGGPALAAAPGIELLTPDDLAGLGVIVKQAKRPTLHSRGSEIILESEGSVHVVVPQNLPVALRTEDGNIVVRDVDDVDAETEDGNITLQGVEVDAEARTSDGNIVIRSAGASVMATTDSGDVTVEGEVDAVTIESGDGNIVVRTVGGAVRARTESGNVTVTAEECAELEAHTEDGNIVVRSVAGAMDASTESGNITVDAAGQELPAQLVTGDGNITVRRAPRSLIARTDSGNLSVQDVDPGHVTLTTECGNVTVRMAPGARTRVELDVDGKLTCRVPDDPTADGLLTVSAVGNVSIS